MSAGDLPPGLVAIPAEDKMWTRSVVALMKLQAHAPDGVLFTWQVAPMTVAKKRNDAARTLLDDPERRWVLLLDSDMNPPPDVIQRLWATAEEEGADLVQAAMVKKRPPHEPTGAKVTARGEPSDPLRPCTSDPDIAWDYPTGESLVRLGAAVEMDMAGTGCLLVRRRVFEELEEPWFAARPDGTGSDYNFTLRATDAGFRLMLAPRVPVGHVSCYSYDSADAARCERAEKWRQQIEAEAARRMDADGAARVGGVSP